MKILFIPLKSKQAYIIALLLFFSFFTVNEAKAQFYSVQTNAVEWGTGTFNLEASMLLNKSWTLNAGLAFNPWTLKNNKKIKHWLFESGARYWTWQTYVGRFIGMYAIGTRYNIGVSKYRYDGYGIGLGASYGYSWLLGKRWNIEVEGGLGAMWAKHSKYKCERCGDYVSKGSYLLPVPKLSVNFVYLF